MTTIAYKDGVMCSDTCYSVGKSRVGAGKKIFWSRNIILGCAGSADDREFTEWLLKTVKSPKSLPSITDLHEFASARGVDYDFILVFRRTLRLFYGSCADDSERSFLFELEDDNYVSVGSGADFAVGAMAAGCTAYEAVAAAIKHDHGTSGEIVEVEA